MSNAVSISEYSWFNSAERFPWALPCHELVSNATTRLLALRTEGKGKGLPWEGDLYQGCAGRYLRNLKSFTPHKTFFGKSAIELLGFWPRPEQSQLWIERSSTLSRFARLLSLANEKGLNVIQAKDSSFAYPKRQKESSCISKSYAISVKSSLIIPGISCSQQMATLIVCEVYDSCRLSFQSTPQDSCNQYYKTEDSLDFRTQHQSFSNSLPKYWDHFQHRLDGPLSQNLGVYSHFKLGLQEPADHPTLVMEGSRNFGINDIKKQRKRQPWSYSWILPWCCTCRWDGHPVTSTWTNGPRLSWMTSIKREFERLQQVLAICRAITMVARGPRYWLLDVAFNWIAMDKPRNLFFAAWISFNHLDIISTFEWTLDLRGSCRVCICYSSDSLLLIARRHSPISMQIQASDKSADFNLTEPGGRCRRLRKYACAFCKCRLL